MADQQSQQKREAALEEKLAEIQRKEEEGKYKALAQRLGLAYSDLRSVPIDPDALSVLSEEEAHAANVAVIFKKDSKITAVTIDPNIPTTQKTLVRLKAAYEVAIILTNPGSLQTVLKRYRTIKKFEAFEIGAIDLKEEELGRFEDKIKTVSDIKSQLNEVSATSLLEIIIAGALKTEASDIHLEPESRKVRLRYRLDGLLHDIASFDESSYKKILTRIKVLSKMKLNIHNAPQDGRLTVRRPVAEVNRGVERQGRTSTQKQPRHGDIEVRVSVLPSEFGETIVMRLLDPRTIKRGLDELGMRRDLLEKIRGVLKRPTGAIFTTGPTGSGKTTMLYAFVSYLNSPETKIITIEDPIEYHVEGISQTQVDSRKGYTFANGLRAIVRQDPDIILVGEVRDAETADIALQAALTGHLVLSTIHTNDAAGAISRLIDLGIRSQTIAPAINMAMAQRLIRKLCPSCKKIRKVKEKELKKIKEILEPLSKNQNVDMSKYPKLDSGLKIGTPGKCAECNESGYKGRVGIFEAFDMSRDMEKLILKSPPISEVRDLAVAEGMITMFQDAYLKLIEGVTSFEETERVLG